jgi:hypothetical protein
MKRIKAVNETTGLPTRSASAQWSMPRSHHGRPAMRLWLTALGALVGSVLFVSYLWAGYRLRWRWTGLTGPETVTLWDWLNALALPAALGIAPLLLRHRGRLSRRHRAILAYLLLGFAALVTAGYLVPLAWTGFTGNKLWDWLKLVLLPFAIGTTSLWADPGRLRRRHLLVGGALLALFALLVAAGYLMPWDWTGFSGNTVWNWIDLLFGPVLVATVVLPFLQRELAERFGPPEPLRPATDQRPEPR